MRKSFFLALVFEMVSQTSTLLALQTYPLINQQKTAAPISRDQQNRIAVAGDRIQQIFGAEGFFDVQSDDVGGQIFVKCLNSKSTKPQTITLITESGLTHDLKLLPQEIEFQSILLKPTLTSEKPKQPSLPYRQRLITLMKAMVQGQKIDGYKVTPLKHADRAFKKSLTIKTMAVYHGEHEEGYVYHLKNEGNEPLLLREQSLALPQDFAIALTHTRIQPGETSSLFVITKTKRSS
ncbi:MAG TPA: type-F conjugative transfer system secretin TraK [Alphaproteobacteria bacterium]|nr:type-F conjugative transfer system secretin TraK [Alphaproteobacteria bacterium]HQS93755.1 type-F conjugative transfer system secretin TraK [Alphaproteobacteria bacterium]